MRPQRHLPCSRSLEFEEFHGHTFPQRNSPRVFETSIFIADSSIPKAACTGSYYKKKFLRKKMEKVESSVIKLKLKCLTNQNPE